MRVLNGILLSLELILAGVLVLVSTPVIPLTSYHAAIESAAIFPALAGILVIAFFVALSHRSALSAAERVLIAFTLALTPLLVANHFWLWGFVPAILLWFLTLMLAASVVVMGVVNKVGRARTEQRATAS